MVTLVLSSFGSGMHLISQNDIYSNKSVVSVSYITENACVYTLESINIPFVGEREFSAYSCSYS